MSNPKFEFSKVSKAIISDALAVGAAGSSLWANVKLVTREEFGVIEERAEELARSYCLAKGHPMVARKGKPKPGAIGRAWFYTLANLDGDKGGSSLAQYLRVAVLAVTQDKLGLMAEETSYSQALKGTQVKESKGATYVDPSILAEAVRVRAEAAEAAEADKKAALDDLESLHRAEMGNPAFIVGQVLAMFASGLLSPVEVESVRLAFGVTVTPLPKGKPVAQNDLGGKAIKA